MLVYVTMVTDYLQRWKEPLKSNRGKVRDKKYWLASIMDNVWSQKQHWYDNSGSQRIWVKHWTIKSKRWSKNWNLKKDAKKGVYLAINFHVANQVL